MRGCNYGRTHTNDRFKLIGRAALITEPRLGSPQVGSAIAADPLLVHWCYRRVHLCCCGCRLCCHALSPAEE